MGIARSRASVAAELGGWARTATNAMRILDVNTERVAVPGSAIVSLAGEDSCATSSWTTARRTQRRARMEASVLRW